MIEQINNLSQEEKEILFKAPILLSVLSASWNHEISKKEKADMIELEHIKTFSAVPLLIPYYKEVEKKFKLYFEEIMTKYSPFDDEKRECLKKDIHSLNTIIAKLDKRFAQKLHTSLSSYAEHVKKADENSLLMNFIFPIPIHGFTD